MKFQINKKNQSIKHGCIFSFLIIMAGAVSAHDGHHTDKAWKACEDKKLSDTCSYILQQKMVYKGTCRAVAESLMCVRNQPIEKLEDSKSTH